jgi:hypothetical protein
VERQRSMGPKAKDTPTLPPPHDRSYFDSVLMHFLD